MIINHIYLSYQLNFLHFYEHTLFLPWIYRLSIHNNNNNNNTFLYFIQRGHLSMLDIRRLLKRFGRIYLLLFIVNIPLWKLSKELR